MNPVLRQALVVLVVIPLAVSLLGLRFAYHSTGLRRLIQTALLHEELNQSHRAAYYRIDAREEMVRELIVHRCSLSQALARFEELDGEHPDDIMELSRERNGYDSERNYQYIVELVKDLLEDQPEEGVVVLSRLEKEYQQLRAGRKSPSAMPTKGSERSR